MAKTGSERTKDWRAQLVAQGYKQKAMLLSPAALKDMKATRERFDLASDAEAVTFALAKLQAGANPPKRRKGR